MNLLVGATTKQARYAWVYLCADVPPKHGEPSAWRYCEPGVALVGARFGVIVILPWSRPDGMTDLQYQHRQDWLSQLETHVQHPTDVIYL